MLKEVASGLAGTVALSTSDKDEYGLYFKYKGSRGIILIPFEGSGYDVYHLSPIKVSWWWKANGDNNVKETAMNGNFII